MYKIITAGALGGNSFDLVQSIATDNFAELALFFRTNMAIISSSIKIYFSAFFQSVQNKWIGNNVLCLEFMVNCWSVGNCSTKVQLCDAKNCVRPANNCGVFHCSYNNWVLCPCESKH